MAKHPLGSGAAANRQFFEDDSLFHDRADLLPIIIRAYQKAAGVAAASARRAVTAGTDERRQTALWDEAVAQTFERVLHCLGSESDSGVLPSEPEIDLPERPTFE